MCPVFCIFQLELCSGSIVFVVVMCAQHLAHFIGVAIPELQVSCFTVHRDRQMYIFICVECAHDCFDDLHILCCSCVQKYLHSRYGEAYKAYASHTPKFIPFLW